jgi:hypothetical protein
MIEITYTSKSPPTPNADGLRNVSGQRMQFIPTGCRIPETFRQVYCGKMMRDAKRLAATWGARQLGIGRGLRRGQG